MKIPYFLVTLLSGLLLLHPAPARAKKKITCRSAGLSYNGKTHRCDRKKLKKQAPVDAPLPDRKEWRSSDISGTKDQKKK